MDSIPPRHISVRRESPSGIWTGLVSGVVIGLLGIVQVYLYGRYYSDRQVELDAERIRYPNTPDVGQDIAWKNTLFGVGTAIIALLLAVLLCMVAAYWMARRSGRAGPGVQAAVIASAIGW